MEEEKAHVIIDLILKSWEGNLTLEEEKELNELLEDPRWARMKSDLEDDRFVTNRFREYGKYNTSAEFSAFMGKVKKKKSSKWTWWGMSCVASVVLIVFVGLLMNERKSDKRIQLRGYTGLMASDRNQIRLIVSEDKMITLTEREKHLELDSMGVCLSDNLQTLNYARAACKDSTSSSIQYHTLLVPKGQICRLILSDSSRVVLNAETMIKYPVAFSGNKREVYIDGEAYFEVTKDENRPFIVAGKSFSLEVLGTSFNVKNYEDEFASNITLLTGSIRMNTLDSLFQVKPGEQVVILPDKRVKVHKVDTKFIVSWMNHRFNFDHEELETIMRRIGRWYDVEVLYEKPMLRQACFTGTLPYDVSLSELLDLLNNTTDIKFTYRNGVISVSELND